MATEPDSSATAITHFSEPLSAPETDHARDAAIQRFECYFESAWKETQEWARTEWLDLRSPRGCLTLVYTNNWIGIDTE
jgi:hypothetical protein